MMQFSQAMAPQTLAVGSLGNKTALATGKGFNQEQIPKLWDACGVLNTHQIPAIWVMIQANK